MWLYTLYLDTKHKPSILPVYMLGITYENTYEYVKTEAQYSVKHSVMNTF